MIIVNLKCGLTISIFAFLVACQHPTVAPATPAEFLVSPEQSRQINSIIISVSAELSASNYASFTEKKITNTLGKYDSQIHNILGPDSGGDRRDGTFGLNDSNSR